MFLCEGVRKVSFSENFVYVKEAEAVSGEVFCKKEVFKNFRNFTEKQLL